MTTRRIDEDRSLPESETIRDESAADATEADLLAQTSYDVAPDAEGARLRLVRREPITLYKLFRHMGVALCTLTALFMVGAVIGCANDSRVGILPALLAALALFFLSVADITYDFRGLRPIVHELRIFARETTDYRTARGAIIEIDGVSVGPIESIHLVWREVYGNGRLPGVIDYTLAVRACRSAYNVDSRDYNSQPLEDFGKMLASIALGAGPTENSEGDDDFGMSAHVVLHVASLSIGLAGTFCSTLRGGPLLAALTALSSSLAMIADRRVLRAICARHERKVFKSFFPDAVPFYPTPPPTLGRAVLLVLAAQALPAGVLLHAWLTRAP